MNHELDSRQRRDINAHKALRYRISDRRWKRHLNLLYRFLNHPLNKLILSLCIRMLQSRYGR